MVEVAQRIVCGTQVAVETRLRETQGKASAIVNTAYIERLQATFRAHLAPLVRRSRAPVRLSATLWKPGCGWSGVATTSAGPIGHCADCTLWPTRRKGPVDIITAG